MNNPALKFLASYKGPNTSPCSSLILAKCSTYGPKLFETSSHIDLILQAILNHSSRSIRPTDRPVWAWDSLFFLLTLFQVCDKLKTASYEGRKRPGLESWPGTLCRTFYSTLTLLSQCLCPAHTPSRESRNTPGRFMPHKQEINAGLLGHSARIFTFQ